MFKNVTVYRLGAEWSADLGLAEQQIDKWRFVECAASQLQSVGFVAPRGGQGALVESIGGQWLLKLMIETKVLPASVVKRTIQQRAEQIERDTGRKPGKKQTREIKDEVVLELLPRAFTKQLSIALWLDPKQRLLVVEAGSQAKADEVVAALVRALDGLSVALLQTTTSAAVSMSQWLSTREAPAGFSVDRECELKSSDEMKSVVKYSRHGLDNDEVRQHIADGKLPTQLAMTWDSRVSFVLTENLQIRKLAFLDVVFENKPSGGPKDEGFDTDAAIATGELGRLIPDLVDALGGELAFG